MDSDASKKKQLWLPTTSRALVPETCTLVLL